MLKQNNVAETDRVCSSVVFILHQNLTHQRMVSLFQFEEFVQPAENIRSSFDRGGLYLYTCITIIIIAWPSTYMKLLFMIALCDIRLISLQKKNKKMAIMVGGICNNCIQYKTNILISTRNRDGIRY